MPHSVSVVAQSGFELFKNRAQFGKVRGSDGASAQFPDTIFQAACS
jgi:hypothetical protein